MGICNFDKTWAALKRVGVDINDWDDVPLAINTLIDQLDQSKKTKARVLDVYVNDDELQIHHSGVFHNFGITCDNNLVADTNDSTRYFRLAYSLPSGSWSIHKHDTENSVIILKNTACTGIK